MSENNIPTEFGRYLRLYGLHLVEHSVSYELVLRVRVAATRFVTSALPEDMNQSWLNNPNEGISIARDSILPRLDALRSGNDAWEQLGLAQPNTILDAFQNQRQDDGRSILPSPRGNNLLPVKRVPTQYLPNAPLMNGLVRVQKFLEVAQTALVVADTAMRLYQEWKRGQNEQKIIEARRMLLDDAVRAAETSQDHVLEQALDPSFVENYLLTSGNDSAYDILFGDIDDDSSG